MTVWMPTRKFNFFKGSTVYNSNKSESSFFSILKRCFGFNVFQGKTILLERKMLEYLHI